MAFTNKSPLNELQDAYRQYFAADLDLEQLNQVIEQALGQQKEEFLRMQLSMMQLSARQLTELQALLGQEFGDAGANGASTKNARHREVMSSPVAATRPKRGRKSHTGITVKIDTAGLSEGEALKARRREYARQYYARKKEIESSQIHGQVRYSASGRRMLKDPKSYKTSEQQRRYQREYYRRKKVLEGVGQNQKVLSDALVRLAQQNHHEEPKSTLEQAPVNKGFAGGLSSNHNLLNPSAGQVRGPFVEYANSAADRMAIHNAFRQMPLDVRRENSSEGGDAGLKTRLRKGATESK